jgi:HEPN domain-containing protein
MSANPPQQWFDIVDQYYIPTRYPDGIPGGLPDGIPGEAEAKESIEAADAILQFVSKRTGMTYK